jgi:HEPN domain-containing protein
MQPDPRLTAEARAWFVKAASDLRAAAHALTAEPPLYADSTFHGQQAAEKAMEGFLAWHDVPFRRVHSLEELGEQWVHIEQGPRHVLDRAVPLTEYAWKFRYPGEVEEPTAAEAQDASAAARAVYPALSVLPLAKYGAPTAIRHAVVVGATRRLPRDPRCKRRARGKA